MPLPERSSIPNPMEVATIDLSRGSGSGYAWRVVSDCGVVKVYSTRDGCMFALNSHAARCIAKELAEALSTAADATDVRGYGYVVDRTGRRVPEGADPLVDVDPVLAAVPSHLQGLVPGLLRVLEDGPRDRRTLGWHIDGLRAVEAAGLIAIDPDQFPDRQVPGNPIIARLPGDERPWPGWKDWNL